VKRPGTEPRAWVVRCATMSGVRLHITVILAVLAALF